jgi:hypothetical protein
MAIGLQAGQYSQGDQAIAVGIQAGQTGQGDYSIAVGIQSGQLNQGEYSIAIGNSAGKINQPANSIVINATNSALNASVTNGCFIAPIAGSTNSSSTSFALLGYGSDNQLVQTNIRFAHFNITHYIDQNGRFGIGTSTPSFKLDIIGDFRSTSTISSSTFTTSSDIRIKKNIKLATSMLPIINQLEIVSFDFIDPKYPSDDCGLIAQQVKDVFPNAITKTFGVIPCFFVKEKTHFIDENDNLVILFDTNEPVNIGDKIKILYGLNPAFEAEVIVTVLKVVNGGFVCEKWDKYNNNVSILIYGKEVDDLHTIDKDKLGIMALKGLQKLDIIIKQQKQTISTLQQKLNKTKDILSQLIIKYNYNSV